MAVNSFNAQNPPVTTKGDVFTFSTIPTRLAVGANNTVLTADSTTATGLKWASPSAAKSYSLLNAGGTALTGAATITVSGISGIDDILVLVVGASAVNANSNIAFRLNSDTGSNYRYGGSMIIGGSGFDSNNFTTETGNPTSILTRLGQTSAAADTVSGIVRIFGCNTSGVKPFLSMGSGANTGGSGERSYYLGGVWESSSTVSSINIVSGNGNFDAGTIYVYGAA